MTTRPGNGAEQLWRGHRTKSAANLVEITRTDGYVLRFTDHDRPISFEGATFSPAIFAGLSADRREAALRTGDQNLHGIIDGTIVTIPDLLGNVYRGAEVRRIITDWQRPWWPVARHRRFIRTVHWNGSAFVGVMEGRSQVLTRPAGGRFGGMFTVRCPYVLGGPYCPAIVVDSVGVRVNSVSRQKYEFAATASTWESPSAEHNYYRMGEIEWLWALPLLQRQTTTGATTSTTLTDSGAGMTTNAHVGRTLRMLSGAIGYVNAYATITANTATTITYATQADMSGFAIGTYYDICSPCDNVGVVSPIETYTAGTVVVELTYPTPFPIAVGDGGIVRPGCDGLRTTCATKYGAQMSFGGRDHLSPLVGAVAEPPAEQ